MGKRIIAAVAFGLSPLAGFTAIFAEPQNLLVSLMAGLLVGLCCFLGAVAHQGLR